MVVVTIVIRLVTTIALNESLKSVKFDLVNVFITTLKFKFHKFWVTTLGDNYLLTILTGKNLCFTEFSTKIHWNAMLAAFDVFQMFTQSIKLFQFHYRMSEKHDSSNRQ